MANGCCTGMLPDTQEQVEEKMNTIAVIGAAGRMGGAIIRALEAEEELALGCALERADCPVMGEDAGTIAGLAACGVPIVDGPENQTFDIMIDFSTPASSLLNIEHCRQTGCSIVIGTTGMNEEVLEKMRQAAEKIPVLFSANYSVGVNVVAKLLKLTAAAIGEQSDIEIIEAHHKHKVDAPSGTALLLGNAIADTMGKTLAKDGVFCREGIIGEREQGSIGFSTIRGGDIAGEHSVLFIGEAERIEITHRATDRKIFANGAVRAAKWLSQQPPGLYDMNDVLGLK